MLNQNSSSSLGFLSEALAPEMCFHNNQSRVCMQKFSYKSLVATIPWIRTLVRHKEIKFWTGDHWVLAQ